MKLVPRMSDKMDVLDDSRLNQTHSVEGSAITIPMHELELFAEGVLRENCAHVGSSCPRMTALSAAQKILRVRSEITAVLAPLGPPMTPTLDIILDLFSNESLGGRVSVTDAGIAGHCAPTTGIRWVTALEDAGIVQKTDDPLDHRRTFVSLTDEGHELALDCIQVYLSDGAKTDSTT